ASGEIGPFFLLLSLLYTFGNSSAHSKPIAKKRIIEILISPLKKAEKTTTDTPKGNRISLAIHRFRDLPQE
ncbi:hypothetical protein N9073_06545, partial [Akkermansiaceae bacterium]|nr:hypothetical protein [Akkermansiaceae bacterium]